MGGIHKVIILLATLLPSFNNAHQHQNDLNAYSTLPSSFGQDFTLLIPENRIHGANQSESSFVIINPDYLETKVEIRIENGISTNSTVLTVYGEEEFEYIFDDDIATSCNGTMVVDCLYRKVKIHSAGSIAVLVNNYIDGIAGDSFTAVPNSMAGKDYVISMTNPSPDGIITVYFMGFKTLSIVNLLVYTENSKPDKYVIYLKNNETTAFQTTYAFTMYASSVDSFSIIVSEQMMIRYRSEEYDYGAFMPTPVIVKSCGQDYADDYHFNTLTDSRLMLLSVSNNNCFANVQTYGKGNLVNTLNVSISKMLRFPAEYYAASVGIYSTMSMLQVTRYGGFGVDLYTPNAFLDFSISYSQFATKRTAFHIPSDQNIVTLIADEDAHNNIFFDNNEYFPMWAEVLFGEEKFYLAAESLSKGLHEFHTDGFYAIYINGIKNGAGYGFVASFNDQTLKPLPTSSTIKPTTTAVVTSSTAYSTSPTTTTTKPHSTSPTTTTTNPYSTSPRTTTTKPYSTSPTTTTTQPGKAPSTTDISIVLLLVTIIIHQLY